MTSQSFDAVVIGGGIIGVSSAYQLVRRGVSRVAILEKGAQVGSGSTGQSSAVVRQRYANREVVDLAYWSLQMFENWRDRLELDQDRSGFQPVGVLWMPDAKGDGDARSAELFEAVGAAGGYCDVEVIREAYPALNLCSRALDLMGEEHECVDPTRFFWEQRGGYADPQGTTEDLLRAGRARGVELFVNHRVDGVEVKGAGTFTIQCDNGSNFNTPLLLNASGPWCHDINRMLGVNYPMTLRPTRVQVATRDRPAEVEGDIPVFVSAADQFYGRPEGGGSQFLVGSVRSEDESEPVEDPDRYDQRASSEFRERMMHLLHHRFDMRSRGNVRGYAGLYTVNVDDWHPIVDSLGPTGYFVANGFSGHGFKLGPSVGAMIARMMSGLELDDDPTVSHEFFAANRQPISSSGGVLA